MKNNIIYKFLKEYSYVIILNMTLAQAGIFIDQYEWWFITVSVIIFVGWKSW